MRQGFVPRAVRAGVLGVAAALALATAQAQDKPVATAKPQVRTPIKWQPGEQMPIDDLMNYPCHFDDLPCGKIAPPKIEKVRFDGPLQGDAERGKKIALDIRWGNCVACHSLPGGIEGGSIGPSLAEYGKRGMPLDYTFQRIWDVRAFNPNAFMPIYGPNRVLTREEILDVMTFLESGK